MLVSNKFKFQAFKSPQIQSFTKTISPIKIIPTKINAKKYKNNNSNKLIIYASQKLSDLPLASILNQTGYIMPEIQEDTQAAIFAIFDKDKKLQFVGFSKDVGESLRKVFTRRPDKAYFYKLFEFKELNQEEMGKVRDGWFEEVGGPPIGNRIGMERDAWSNPVDAGALSSRANRQAAEEKAKDLYKLIKSRGCNENFIANVDLLDEGKVEMLLASTLSPEELQHQREEMEKVAQQVRQLKSIVQEQEVDFQMFFSSKFQTNGGYWFDASVTYDENVTDHRVIVGDEYYAPYNIDPDTVVERAFQFLISIKQPLQTEGILISNQFPVNYFSISELCQTFPSFQKLYEENQGVLPDMYWRWNRLHNYGGMTEDVDSLSLSMGIAE
eukprot:TRINITY_DN7986_c0_g3_i2.p1 TRINITY_DN7986_c0_g3~~TRINITY_DN7986_c0_g3_i2.p1  ORF type:complete len:405 (-),score=70.97 TRINITY_DN7986_c0_g3_i2:1112-2263(-)